MRRKLIPALPLRFHPVSTMLDVLPTGVVNPAPPQTKSGAFLAHKRSSDNQDSKQSEFIHGWFSHFSFGRNYPFS